MELTTLSTIKYKEKGVYRGLLATTHIDKENEMLTKNALLQIKEAINNESVAGGSIGSYRAISVSHDWIKENDPTLDAAGYAIAGTAEVVELPGGHWGVEADVRINEYYKGPLTAKEIEHRIDIGDFAGFSIEFAEDKTATKKINLKGKTVNVIDRLIEYCGAAFAKARKIANPNAILYKEVTEKLENIENNINNQVNKDVDTSNENLEVTVEKLEEASEKQMVEEEKKVEETITEQVITETPVEQNVEVKESSEPTTQEVAMKESNDQDIKLKIKEILSSKEFRDEFDKNLNVSEKVIPQVKEKMEENVLSISMKEMTEAIQEKDMLKYKEARSTYFNSNADIDAALNGHGIPLRPTLKIKCQDNQLRIMDSLKFKDTLDTTTNPTGYTQNIAEFADVYTPGLVETFNNQTTLFGYLRKVDHLEGTDRYGWTIRTSRVKKSAVDPNDPSIDKEPVEKLKIQTPIKEYRRGVSVVDYMLHHSRRSLGDLFAIEVDINMKDMMVDINEALYAEQDDSGLELMGLPAVANTASFTTLYGIQRTAANRLAPDAAADTYVDVDGALTGEALRAGFRHLEKEGTLRQDIRIICNPVQRDDIIRLESNKRRYNEGSPRLGFSVFNITYNDVPVIWDNFCPVGKIFIIDDTAGYVVVSRAPQLMGLAKVGAAEEAFISTYLAHVYETPRRIRMLDNVSGVTVDS